MKVYVQITKGDGSHEIVKAYTRARQYVTEAMAHRVIRVMEWDHNEIGWGPTKPFSLNPSPDWIKWAPYRATNHTTKEEVKFQRVDRFLAWSEGVR